MLPRLPFIAFVLLLTACPPKRVDFGRDGEPRSAEELLARINHAEAQIISITGDAKLGVDSPQGKGSVTLFVAVLHPALVHIEQLDFFGRPQGVFVTDGERFGLYQAAEGAYFRGPATAPNLGRFLPVTMPPAELAAVLLGRAPRIRHDALEMSFDAAQQLYVLKLTKGNVVQTLLVQPPSYRVVHSSAVNLDAYDLSFSDLSDEGGVTLPKTARLVAKQVKTSIELSLKSITVNDAPDLTLFELQAPEDIPVVEVDAKGDPRQPPAQ